MKTIANIDTQYSQDEHHLPSHQQAAPPPQFLSELQLTVTTDTVLASLLPR